MRNMSFALTTTQIIERTKTVTRRLGWQTLKTGDKIRACKKCMGFKKGEKIEPLAILEVVDVRREPLDTMDDPSGNEESRKEGFPEMTGSEFVTMFCQNMKCGPYDEVTRIEFKYLDHDHLAE